LLAVAVIPAAAGLAGAGARLDLRHGFSRAMLIAAGLAVLGAVLAWMTIRTAVPVRSVVRADVSSPCVSPSLRDAS
jgi:ABC-type Fe3+ transport system permease subunit